MKKYIISLLLLLINISGFTQNNNIKINNMTNDVEIVVFNKSQKNWVSGIIPVNFLIKNNTKHEISLLLPYPNPMGLSFDTQSSVLEKKPQEDLMIDVRVVPTEISSGETYEIVYFLNRYFNFVSEGEFEIFYSLETMIDIEDSESSTRVYEGKFSIELQNPSSNEELKEQYSYYSNHLKSDDEKLRKEAAEALSFIDNPLCIDYIIPMLSIENLETTGIEALSRFNTSEPQQLILNMLSHREFFVVSTAIAALNSMNVQIPRTKFINMLSSENGSIVFIGLENLALTPDVDDKEYIIPLLKHYDPIIAEEAKKYHSLLNKKSTFGNK